MGVKGGYQKLRFEAVPTEVLSSIENVLDPSFYSMMSPYFNMDESTGQLNNFESLFSLQVNIINVNAT